MMAALVATAPVRVIRARAAASGALQSPANIAITALVTGAVAVAAVWAVRWAIIDATWRGTAQDCRVNDGACWAFVGHKISFMLFGLYPAEERWRPALAVGLLLVGVAVSANPRFWRKGLAFVWLFGSGIAYWLLRGGAGLVPVSTQAWSGLPVTIVLTLAGLGLGFIAGIPLALARHSGPPVIRTAAAAIVEGTRGVPLVSVLYFTALVVPLALPPWLESSTNKFLLALVAVALFAGAYLAEAVRAGLQIVPPEQGEAASALGLTWWQGMRLVVLPQALRVVIPAFISIAIGLFQDTSLIVVIGLFDLLNSARLAAQDPAWLGFHGEAYVFAAAVFFAGSVGLSRYGLWLENRLRVTRRVDAPAIAARLLQLRG